MFTSSLPKYESSNEKRNAEKEDAKQNETDA